ncbi:MAG: GNAT family N-acetyltransferase [Saprospiraceae bacterium]
MCAAEYQGKGLGKLIMQRITNFIKNQLPASCYTSLIADGNASYLYEQFGFKDTLPESKGMYIKNE